MITLKTTLSISLIVSAIFQVACNNPQTNAVATDTIKPIFVTDAVRYDSDDPAIWINKSDPSKVTPFVHSLNLYIDLFQ